MTQAVWSGVYATAEGAGSAAGEHPNLLFELRTWLSRQRDLADRTAELLRDGCQGPRPSLLPAIVAGTPEAIIVDLGGGSGWVCPLLRGLGLAPRRYVVRDLAQVVDYYRGHPVEGVEYQYLDDPPLDAGSSVDLRYANSSLQYMPDNAGLLDQLRRLRPRTLLIDELLWSRGDQDWFTIQRNSDSASVTRFASLRQLVAEVEREGMKLAWEGTFGAGHNGYAFPDMSNFSSDLATNSALSLVFVRELGR